MAMTQIYIMQIWLRYLVQVKSYYRNPITLNIYGERNEKPKINTKKMWDQGIMGIMLRQNTGFFLSV